MIDTTILTIYGGLFLTGLAMSLHCIGMCGPILAGFSQAFTRAELTVEGEAVGRRRSIAWSFLWYHTGRLWTYALLGLIAGLAGDALRHSAALLGWHRAAGAVIGIVVMLSGLMLLGVVPGVKADGFLEKSALRKWSGARWLTALLSARGAAPRLLLGAVMGFLPCGLVYAMLAVVAALPTPWHAAVGMIVFGLGTLPSLTLALLAGELVPARWRRYGSQVAAVLILLAGAWMTARSLWVHEHTHQPHARPGHARITHTPDAHHYSIQNE